MQCQCHLVHGHLPLQGHNQYQYQRGGKNQAPPTAHSHTHKHQNFHNTQTYNPTHIPPPHIPPTHIPPPHTPPTHIPPPHITHTPHIPQPQVQDQLDLKQITKILLNLQAEVKTLSMGNNVKNHTNHWQGNQQSTMLGWQG